jgi:hypothetical protein
MSLRRFPRRDEEIAMNRKKQILLGAGAAVALSVAAAAVALAPEGHDPMAMFDKDGNGALSLAEMTQGAEAMFAEADTNRDGKISPEEMAAHHRMGGPHRGGPGGHGGHGGPGGPGAGPDRPHPPMQMDQDGDGQITIADVRTTVGQHFAKIDANHDGSITREEMEAAHRAMHGGG